MADLKTIDSKQKQIEAIGGLANAFESISSIRISQIRDKVLLSESFFSELWNIYSQLRKEPKERFKQRESKIKKDAIIIVTSKGKLSGDLDLMLVNKVVQEIDLNKVDLITIGAHGASLLRQKKVEPVKVFEMPRVEKDIDKIYLNDVSNLIDLIDKYQKTFVYYQSYKSLGQQEVKKIELIVAVQQLTQTELAKAAEGEIIVKKDYIFEPSFAEVIDYMEGIMLKIALNQILLESRLAQHASRFNAMSRAGREVEDLSESLMAERHRASREKTDKNLKEVVTSLMLQQQNE